MAEGYVGGVRPKRRRGCLGCLGCLGVLALLGVLLVVAVWLGPGLLRKLGILGPDATELFSGAPDPVAGAAVSSVLESYGFQGVEALVIPIKGSDEQILILSLDDTARLGTAAGTAEAEVAFRQMAQDLVQTNQQGGLGISQVAVNYHGEDGQSLVTIAAPQEAIEAYAAGQITRREFVAQVDIDYTNLISAEELRQLLEEVR